MTSYDEIALDYQKCKFAPWRVHVERHTLFNLLGDLSGKSVLDMACGEGIYSRQVSRHGAAKVVGVDLSHGMIDLARQEESRKPLGIEYHVHDAATIDLGQSFDVVLASYLFNYAQTHEQLDAMTRSVARHLKPGGRLISVNNHPGQSPDAFEKTRPYGVIKSTPSATRPIQEGTPIIFTIFQDQSSFTIENYHLTIQTHDASFTKAGLRPPAWIKPEVSPEGQSAFEPGYWNDFLIDPPVIFLTTTTH